MFDKAFSGPRRLTFDPRFDPEYLSTFQRSGPVESWVNCPRARCCSSDEVEMKKKMPFDVSFVMVTCP